MRHRPFYTAAIPRLPLLERVWLALLALSTLVVFATRADASTALCGSGTQCSPSMFAASVDSERELLEFASTMQYSARGPVSARRAGLSSQEFYSFSGVGAIVCTVNGKQRMSTAFLVGAFDIAVTVAHTFEDSGTWTSPDNCIYTSTDSLGQIRERIPLASIKAQWESEPAALGQPAKDFAVVRLSEQSRYAQRTMPMGKFSGMTAPVVMVGFRADMESDPMKSKGRGMVYERQADGVSLADFVGFMHDIDASGIAAGAPVIEERTGVIIGIHTLCPQAEVAAGTRAVRNTMITMNEWLEQALRVEMQTEEQKGASSL
jgi:Trypsin-like peptidase domain